MLAGYSAACCTSQIPLQAAQKGLRGEAREKLTSGGVLRVRWSEAIERNEAYGPFSAAWLHHTELESRGFGHFARIPRWIPNEFNLHIGDVRNRLHLRLNLCR
jgi:hypothetical protein